MSRYLALIVHRSFGLAKAEPQRLAEIQQPLSVEEEGRRREDVSARNGGRAAQSIFFSLSLLFFHSLSALLGGSSNS